LPDTIRHKFPFPLTLLIVLVIEATSEFSSMFASGGAMIANQARG
jgi:hypothetical protein